MTPSKILFYFCLAFIVGVFFESIYKTPQFVLWIFLFSAVSIISIYLAFAFSQIRIRFVDLHYVLLFGFCALFLLLGVLRMQISEFNISNDKLSQLNDKGEISLAGVVANEPDIRGASQKLKIKTDDFGSIVLVTTGRYPEYQYLDMMKITGKLKTPMETEDFSYKNYLMKDRIYSVMDFPKIEKLDRGRASIFSYGYSGILWLKGKMRQSIKNIFLAPESSVLEGIILGNGNAISQDMKNKFKITGLSHIIAVSGTHVVILSSILMSFLLFLGLWRSQAFYIAVIFILIYVVLVGLPASGIRASIMGIIYLLGQKIGRQTMGARVIVLAAALMLIFNPLLLFYDIGFQLSFLAVLGLILLEPQIRQFFKFLIKIFGKREIKSKYESAIMMVSSTMAAQIFTLPVIIFNFGNISFVSLFTNILVLPAVYFIMFFGFLSALAGMIFSQLGWLLSLPCYFLMKYFLWVTDFFSKPWAYKIVENVHWVWLLVSYIFLGVAIKYFNKKLRQDFLNY
jgi:competence protein ComEC